MVLRPPRSTLFPYTRSSDLFTPGELDRALGRLEQGGPPHAIRYQTAKTIRVLAASSYVTRFPADSALSERDRKSTRLNSSHVKISYAVFCLKKKNSRTRIHR